MKVRRVAGRIRAGCVAGIIAFNVVALAEAEEAIGVAAVVRNQVDQALPTRVIPINVGENITRDEVVKTGMESAAKLVFSDNTNLSMGPGSAVTLNKFVYSGAGSYEKATFQLVKGAFRFTTGGSDKRAYEIKTPTATIGVRRAQSWISALTPLPLTRWSCCKRGPRTYVLFRPVAIAKTAEARLVVST